MIRDAYISVGSNIGDRHAYLERAVTALSSLAEGEMKLSGPIETLPWGFDGSGPFLNLCLTFPTSLSPAALLDRILEVQHAIDSAPHRNPDGSYADRRIDIDLIALGNLKVDSPQLTLPHPRMHLRDFVLIPLREIAPEWVHPVLGLTLNEMLNDTHC